MMLLQKADSATIRVLGELTASGRRGNVLNWVSLVLSALGFIVVFIQLRKTKAAAQAAREATDDALSALSQNHAIGEISLIVGLLQEIQAANRGGRFETALLRVQEVRTHLAALRNRPQMSQDEVQSELQTMIALLRKAQDSYEDQIAGRGKGVNTSLVNKSLAANIVQLHMWRDKITFAVAPEASNVT